MSSRAFRCILTLLFALALAGGSAAQTATPEPCPASQFVDFGAVGVVTPGDSNNVRADPTTGSALIGKVAPGDPFRVYFRSATCADGYLWIEIQTMTMRGWTVEIPVGGDEPFVVPYEAETREIGQRAEDGSIRVEDSGVAFTVPAGLNIAKVTVTPEVGLFGDSMSAQPSSVVFTLLNDEDEVRGEIEIYPYRYSDAVYELYRYERLEGLLTDRPPLLDYAASRRMPQVPIGGAAALFGGAGMYLSIDSGGGIGLRYVTMFAQDYVLFQNDMTFEYLFRGFSTELGFFVTGQNFPVKVPVGTIPVGGSRADDAYPDYLRQFEANLAAQPTSAFTPDLALYDAIFASLTVTDGAALFDAIP